jgi:hypothetical protein
MASANEIKSEKILLKDVFNMWFRIPEYQRPYVWGYEEVRDLLDDLTFAATNKPEAQYFLGSLVFQSKPADKSRGQNFVENDLLDGQQRLTTLLLFFAVLRDVTSNQDIKETCQSCIYQKANAFKHIPERVRLEFHVRENVKTFVEQFIKKSGGTKDHNSLQRAAETYKDTSVLNMTKAITVIRDFLSSSDAMEYEDFLEFILNKVLLIYVSTEDLEDAFRLFTILNNRGIPLRNSDILKSLNLGALENETDKIKYARMWEEAEGELGEEFDRFLAHLRTILVKEKARLNLLQEFEGKIYDPKEKDKVTGQPKPVLLKKGKPTFQLVEKYLADYKLLLSSSNYDVCQSFAFDNLISVMRTGLFATDWIPPLLAYYDKFRQKRLLEFLHKLNAKFAGDWLSQKTPTDRIEAMNDIIKIVEKVDSADAVLASSLFSFDGDAFLRVVESNVYGRRFALYILLALDYIFQQHAQKMHFETLSVEHILPQTPSDTSQWVKLFGVEERRIWTDRLGNLVLITRIKNSSQGRLDYSEKRDNYFRKNIDTCPNSIRVLNKHTTWTPKDVADNHQLVVGELKKFFNLAEKTTA